LPRRSAARSVSAPPGSPSSGCAPRGRSKGLGEALLRQAFHDLYARGRHRIALGVDAENSTGATRLYERVGMKVVLRDDAYEKLLESREGD
jgi:ribosomal protein S18 acetylase RimI-like enzyme